MCGQLLKKQFVTQVKIFTIKFEFKLQDLPESFLKLK